MCNASAPKPPKQFQPTEAVNGTWTPVKAFTPEERARVTTSMATVGDKLAMGGFNLGDSLATQAIADRDGQAAADAAKLAAIPRQEEKTVRPIKQRAGMGAGGPSSLVTGGTTAAALNATRRSPGATLLGG